MTRVRFAPSPTGYLHIGGARTALYNWMYARAQKGEFVLRIEDTDKVRSKKEYLDTILGSMQWLGLNWDKLYYQSQRFDIYQEYAQKLLDQNKAYKDGEAIVLKMPHTQVKIYDLIRGEIQFDTTTLKDQVLIKSDGSPAYSFACVVDDALMEISCVIRGEDHISNTPKQIIIYQALDWKIPKYAHLPLIMGEDGARLSKRAGAIAVGDYRKRGFLPEAIVNYLMLLGWSPGENQEKISLLTAVRKFSVKKINKASAMFSIDKLKWLNAQYIKQSSTEILIKLLVPFLKEKGYAYEKISGEKLKNIVDLYKGRLATLEDFVEWTEFIFVDQLIIDPEAKEKFLNSNKSKEFLLLADRLRQIDHFDASSAEKIFREVVSELGINTAELVHPVRVALTGKSVGIGLFDAMAFLGKEKTVKRLLEVFGN